MVADGASWRQMSIVTYPSGATSLTVSYAGTMTDVPTLVTPMELAKIINVSRRTVYRYRDAGRLAAVKVGGLWKIDLRRTLINLGLIEA